MRLERGTVLRAAVGVAVSAIAIAVLLTAVDLRRAAAVLSQASPAWIGVMLVTVSLDLTARSARWRVLLAPIAKVPLRRVAGYTLIGYLANNALPARLGELVRVHVLGEREGLSRPTVLGTVVVERISDTVLVVLLAAGAIGVLSVRGIVREAVAVGAAFAALLIVGLAVLVLAHRWPGADRAAGWLARWPVVVEIGRRLREGLAIAGRPRTIAAAVAVGILAWMASIGTFLAAGQAIGIELALSEAALLCSGVALATIVPSGPGYLGTFELTAVGIGATLGIGEDEAFALALLVHALVLAVTSIGGAVAFVRMGLGSGRVARSAPEEA